MASIRSSEGGAYESRGKFFARVTVAPQKREGVLLPWCTSLDAALVRARAIQPLVNQLREANETTWIPKVLEIGGAADEEKLAALGRHVAGIVEGKIVKAVPSTTTVVTFRHILDRWTRGDLAREYPDYIDRKRSWRGDVSRAKHVPDACLDLPIAAWTTETYEGAMRQLSRDLGSGSRRHVAQIMHRVCELAVYPLRAIKVNPVPRLPKVKSERLLATLYPSDALGLSGAESIDLGFRVLWNFYAETGWRVSQAVGRTEPDPEDEDDEDESVPPLFWRDLDFDHGKALLSRTKTTGAVEVPLDEWTLDGLKTWRALSPRPAPGDRVFVTTKGAAITEVKIAEIFRAHLNLAGITRETRPELFPEGKELKIRRPARVHDCRGLFVTSALAQGRSDTWVRERTLHETPTMLDVYRARVPHFERFGPVRPMVEAVPEIAAAFAAARRGGKPESRDEGSAANPALPPGFPREDSNLCKRNQNPLSCH